MAMYEYGIERFDELPRIIEHLRRFHTALMGDADSLQLTSAYSQYVRDELSMSEDETDIFIKQQQETAILPDISILLADRDEAVDAYRMAVLKGVAPYKLALSSTVEHDLWLPNALELILPTGNDRHDADICLRTNGIDKDLCERGECPVKYLRQQAEAVQRPDFSSLEYQLLPEKLCRGVHTLLSSTRDKGIITPIERNIFARQYMQQYNVAFPAPTRKL